MAKMTFAEALTTGNYRTVEACEDCTVAQVNGDYSGMDDQRAERVSRAWSAIAAERGGAVITYGVAEHSEHCRRESDGECDCGRTEFTWTRCDVCGGGGGSRDVFLVVYDVR